MVIKPELLVAMDGAVAAFVSAIVLLLRWVEEQDNNRYELLRREVSNEVRAEIGGAMLNLNVQWLSSAPETRDSVRVSSDLEQNHED